MKIKTHGKKKENDLSQVREVTFSSRSKKPNVTLEKTGEVGGDPRRSAGRKNPGMGTLGMKKKKKYERKTPRSHIAKIGKKFVQSTARQKKGVILGLIQGSTTSRSRRWRSRVTITSVKRGLFRKKRKPRRRFERLGVEKPAAEKNETGRNSSTERSIHRPKKRKVRKESPPAAKAALHPRLQMKGAQLAREKREKKNEAMEGQATFRGDVNVSHWKAETFPNEEGKENM